MEEKVTLKLRILHAYHTLLSSIQNLGLFVTIVCLFGFPVCFFIFFEFVKDESLITIFFLVFHSCLIAVFALTIFWLFISFCLASIAFLRSFLKSYCLLFRMKLREENEMRISKCAQIVSKIGLIIAICSVLLQFYFAFEAITGNINYID